ncbi:MAG: hypothetical protein D6731_10230 [Planctomycetota bacterium]|nr:MAG: hypothetical protein D6731_10230 [Planctomycetota bacterium]
MGAVYRARDVRLGRLVALKVIRSGFFDEEALARFGREARAVAKLQHPGIVPLYDAGHHEGQPYIAMGYVEGRTLEEVLREGGLSPRRLAEVLAHVADALAHAHAQGVVHRDVKPQNIMLDAAGQPHLLDFGLARDASAKEELTQTGQVLGTLHYMAPEQASGEASAQGPPCDVYALGAVLYRALTGRAPFSEGGGGQLAILKRVLLDEVAAPSRFAEGVHPDLETIALRCMEKDPQRRYPGAAELADELRRFVDGEPIRARPIGRRERLRRWAARNRALAAVLAASATVVVGLLAAGVAGGVAAVQRIRAERDRAQEERARAEREKARAEEEQQRAEAEKTRAVRLLAKELRAKGAGLADRARYPEAWALFARSLELDGSFETRLRLADARSRTPRTLWRQPTGHSGWPAALAVRPGGRVLVVGAPGGGSGAELRVLGAQGRLLARSTLDLGKGSRLSAAVFDPTGSRLATASRAAGGAVFLRFWSLEPGEGGADTLVLRALGERSWSGARAASSLALHPASGLLAAGPSGPGRPGLWRVGPAGTVEARAAPAPLATTAALRALAFSADGKLLVGAGLDRRLWAWDLESGATAVAKELSRGLNGVALSPDGELVATGGGRGDVRLWRVLREPGLRLQAVETLSLHSAGVNDVAFAPERREASGVRTALLASAGMDRTVRLWRVERRQGSVSAAPVTALPCPDDVRRVAFDASGRVLVARTWQGVLTAWDLAPLEASRPRWPHPSDVSALSVSSDGATLAVGAWFHARPADRPVVLYEFERRGPGGCFSGCRFRGELAGRPGGVTRLVFHPRRPGQLFGAGHDGSVVRWDLENSAAPQAFAEGSAAPRRFARALAVGPRGRLLAWSEQRDRAGTVVVWDLVEGGETARFALPRPVEVLAFGPRGRWLAGGDWRPAVWLCDLAGGGGPRLLRGEAAPRQAPTALAFAPDRGLVAWGARQRDADLRLWGVGPQASVLRLRGHPERVAALAFAHGGELLASGGGDGTVRLWRVPAAPSREDPPRALAVFRAGAGDVRALAFAPDDRVLVSGHRDGSVRCWSLPGKEAPSGGWLAEVARVAALGTNEENEVVLARPPSGR